MLSTTFSDARGDAPLMSRVVSSPAASHSLQSSPASLAPAPADVFSRGRSRSVGGCEPSSIAGACPVSGSRDQSSIWRPSERAATPPSGDLTSWWRDVLHLPSDETEDSDKRRQKPVEDVDGYMRTRERVSAAATSALGLATDVVHELLNIGADVLRFAPVPGLELAAIALLKVWDALQLVDVNRTACVQLTERCATVLLSVRAEIAEAGDDVALELHIPLDRLVESFREVHRFLVKQANRPFIRRYLDRDEDERALEGCHGSLTDALGVFHTSVQIRILKQVLVSERQRRTDTAAILDSIRAGRGLMGSAQY